MPIEILEALVIHEPVILGRMRRASAGGNGPGNQAVHFLAALAAQANDDLIRLPRLGERLVDERFEKRLGHQHDMNTVFHDIHESRAVVAVLRIETKAECGKEGFGFVQVPDRKIKNDLFFHDILIGRVD